MPNAENDAPACESCGHTIDPACWCFPAGSSHVIPPEVPHDRAPRNYTEQRALMDDSLRNIPPHTDKHDEMS